MSPRKTGLIANARLRKETRSLFSVNLDKASQLPAKASAGATKINHPSAAEGAQKLRLEMIATGKTSESTGNPSISFQPFAISSNQFAFRGNRFPPNVASAAGNNL